MMDKIIGFTISPKEINHNDIDVFNVGLKLIKINKCGYFLYFWGINNIENCVINGRNTLSFGNRESLLDRNVIIYFVSNQIVIENDWLGSIPIFYNKKEKTVSTLSLKTLFNKTIHPEGLSNFLEAGYSILEQTPFKDVKFMRFYSRLIVSSNGIKIEYKDDHIMQPGVFNEETSEKEVLENLEKYISSIEKTTKNEIIIPTSGGFDSRLLNAMIRDKNRIKSFTYGITNNQSNSIEVVYARELSKILGTEWAQIPLDNNNFYMDDWFKIYGFGTHMHGMYHIEFYKKILEQNNFSKDATFLSGIIGDAWSGKVNIERVTNYKEISNLFYSHGANADNTQLKHISSDYKREAFFKRSENILKNSKARIIFSMRFKIMLLSYLNVFPEYFGFPVWTPFLNYDLAIGMLNLPEEKRKNRIWQKEYFKNNKIDLENMNLKSDKLNILDFQSFIGFNFELLNNEILTKYFKEDYINKINSLINNKPSKMKFTINHNLFRIRGLRRILQFIGMRPMLAMQVHPYRILKTIEKSLKY